ncbi:cytochrome C oxidase subunit III [Sphingobium sp. SCG-1]|uniref:cytochrome c oxidase subunit 3 n=1 Tax=Sphingobium sp. SCG-1 TaxID=2072936 RepID=UPI000CD6B6D8|nr:cytochrome c oxidase subunit 3 [Sphingobium sp. SCG-1]AUW57040.1 cytochrome C oxidase subunit III [Sphingobium sp. SCG-1]
MSAPVRFVGDLAHLPTHAFGPRSITWWGILGFMVVEGMVFALAIAAYFFIMDKEQSWPPIPISPPDLRAGTLFTVLILLTELPNRVIKNAAERYDISTVRFGLVLMSIITLPLLVLRGFEFASLGVYWTDNAYGSVIWMLLFLHATHLLTDYGDTLVLTVLMFTVHGKESNRFVDVSENSLYWRFVWLSWLPIYVLLYWIPRWLP